MPDPIGVESINPKVYSLVHHQNSENNTRDYTNRKN